MLSLFLCKTNKYGMHQDPKDLENKRPAEDVLVVVQIYDFT
ncbi:hypothetical protein [Cardinium endosymbiont of Culicoides punctatus]|nr:hypothetical protein [Cardinium endosymbiont of Culicoides punctatus]